MIKINYNKKILGQHLKLAAVWFLIAIASTFFKADIKAITAGFYLASLAYVSIYFYQKHFGYAVIKNGELTVMLLIKKKIVLADVIQIKDFAGDIILISKEKEVKVAKELLTEEGLAVLKSELKKHSNKKD